MSAESMRTFRLKNPWHRLWYCAKRRCGDIKHRSYKYCGALGIRFLLSQHEVELLFIRDGGHWMKVPSLDRRDANLDYVWWNCRVIEKSINERLPHDKELAAEWTD